MSPRGRLVFQDAGPAYLTFTSARAALDAARVSWGDYYTVGWNGLVIYGHCLTLEELMSNVRANGGGPREVAAEVVQAEDAHRAGFRESECFSVACPEGETGAHHVSACRRITREQFEAARARGWQ